LHCPARIIDSKGGSAVVARQNILSPVRQEEDAAETSSAGREAGEKQRDYINNKGAFI